jgi:hypothetical protein
MSIIQQTNIKSKIKYGGEFGRRGSEFREDQNPEETAIKKAESGLRNPGNKPQSASEKFQLLAELATRTKATLESMQKIQPNPGAEEVINYRKSFEQNPNPFGREAEIASIIKLNEEIDKTQDEMKKQLDAAKLKRQNARFKYQNRPEL